MQQICARPSTRAAYFVVSTPHQQTRAAYFVVSTPHQQTRTRVSLMGKKLVLPVKRGRERSCAGTKDKGKMLPRKRCCPGAFPDPPPTRSDKLDGERLQIRKEGGDVSRHGWSMQVLESPSLDRTLAQSFCRRSTKPGEYTAISACPKKTSVSL